MKKKKSSPAARRLGGPPEPAAPLLLAIGPSWTEPASPASPRAARAGQGCHTQFSKEQNQANHMCAQKVHTYVIMKKYQKQCYYITYT
jgi:hypothetical protein